MHSPEDIERAIDALSPQQLTEFYAWIDEHRAARTPSEMSIFEQGLGLFGNPEDAELLDEVVESAYEERRRPTRTAVVEIKGAISIKGLLANTDKERIHQVPRQADTAL